MASYDTSTFSDSDDEYDEYELLRLKRWEKIKHFTILKHITPITTYSFGDTVFDKLTLLKGSFTIKSFKN